MAESKEATLPGLTPEMARVVRLYLERAAMAVERIHYSRVYMAAFKKAALAVRNMKPD
jgi:hypothetical protein